MTLYTEKGHKKSLILPSIYLHITLVILKVISYFT